MGKFFCPDPEKCGLKGKYHFTKGACRFNKKNNKKNIKKLF